MTFLIQANPDITFADLVNFAGPTDATVYFFMGAMGTLLFFLRLAAAMIGGVDADFDADMDVDVDGGLEAHGTGFSLISLFSILSFTMGAGWMGLACRMEFGMGPLASGISAFAFGFFLMLLASFGMYQMRRMNEPGRYDIRTAIGRTGRVYLRIPPKGEGRGQVQVTVDGRQKVLPAISTGEELASFTDVRVLDVRDDQSLVVERAN
ncbi:MAG: hypothetical protein OER86_10480 [Phycisphaerae bacterium]|nr:hypothetical protein [Phycisphaerae bacterium]